jgi:hypothetical protein
MVFRLEAFMKKKPEPAHRIVLDRSRKVLEPLRILLVGIGGMSALFIGEIWPAAEIGIWTVFAVFLTGVLYRDLREPVNYKSLDFDCTGFRHVDLGGVTEAAWSDIGDAFYVRSFDPFAHQILTEWQFVLKSGKTILVLVEWPHRRRFASSVQENLPFVSGQGVARALRMKGEGRWRCN